jgi:hypothetical protein
VAIALVLASAALLVGACGSVVSPVDPAGPSTPDEPLATLETEAPRFRVAPALSSASGLTVTVQGYPLDRSLEGLLAFRDVDVIALVGDLKVGSARWTTANGLPPAYISEGREPTELESRTLFTIVTPVTGQISKAILGVADETSITFLVGGGSVDGVTMEMSTELAPDLDELLSAKRVVVAGKDMPIGVDAYFVYALGPDSNRLTSLMDSASDSLPSFGVDDLVKAIGARR